MENAYGSMKKGLAVDVQYLEKEILMPHFSKPKKTLRKCFALWIKSMLKKKKISIQAYPPSHRLPSKTHQNQPLPRQTFLALSS